MNKKKINGEWITLRGSNKKYPQLDDLDWLYAQLQNKTRVELAKEFNLPYGSINYQLRYFPEDWMKNIKIQRRPHRKYRRSR